LQELLMPTLSLLKPRHKLMLAVVCVMFLAAWVI